MISDEQGDPEGLCCPSQIKAAEALPLRVRDLQAIALRRRLGQGDVGFRRWCGRWRYGAECLAGLVAMPA